MKKKSLLTNQVRAIFFFGVEHLTLSIIIGPIRKARGQNDLQARLKCSARFLHIQSSHSSWGRPWRCLHSSRFFRSRHVVRRKARKGLCSVLSQGLVERGSRSHEPIQNLSSRSPWGRIQGCQRTLSTLTSSWASEGHNGQYHGTLLCHDTGPALRC